MRALILAIPLVLFSIVSFSQVIQIGKDISTYQGSRDLSEHLLKYKLLEVNIAELQKALQKTTSEVNVDLNLGDVTIPLVLFQNNILSNKYRSSINGNVDNNDPDVPDVKTFAGYIRNTSNIVRLTVTENLFKGMIQTEKGYIFFEQAKKYISEITNNEIILVYYETDVIDSPKNICGVQPSQEMEYMNSEKLNSVISEQLTVITGCRILEIATEADFEFWQIYGNDANDEILAILNMVQGVYANTFDLDIHVVFQNVWNIVNDPYEGDPLTVQGSIQLVGELQEEWENNRANIDRDLVHLFTGSGSNVQGIAGIALSIGSVCSSPSTSYGFTRDRLDQFETTAHEIGHHFGGIHADGINCGTENASLMCQGLKDNDLFFSNNSENRIENYITSNEACLLNLENIELVGVEELCNSQSTQVFLDTPLQGTVVWSVDNSLLNITSGQGTRTVTVTAKSTGKGVVELTATLTTGGACNTIEISKSFEIGTPKAAEGIDIVNIIDPLCLDPYQNYLIEANYDELYPEYEWRLPTGWTSVEGGTQSTFITNDFVINITTSPLNGGTFNYIRVRAINDCGFGSSFFLNVDTRCQEYFSIYPNPANDYVIIESDSITQAGEIFIYDESSNIRQRSSLKSTRSVVNISSLPEGIYYLHITYKDGVLRRRLIINRNK
jgi:hypothetical protein